MRNEELAWKISEYMIEEGYYDYNSATSKYNLALDWLNLCCNICQISIDPGRFDEGLLYCGSAWDYAQRQSKCLEEINIELIRFLYTWNAMECIANEIASPNRELQRLSQEVCGFLKRKEIIFQLPASYQTLRENFIGLIKKNHKMDDIIVEIRNPNTTDFQLKEYTKEFVDGAGELFYIVSKIRNKFAHGKLPMPQYDEELEDELSIEKNTILLATQIILLTIAMLLCIEAIDWNLQIDKDSTLIECEKEISAKEFLLSLFDSTEA